MSSACFVIQTPVPAFDVVRPHAAFKHRPRRRRPHAGVDPRRSDVIAQVSLCCCCCFTFQLLKRSGDGSMTYREVGLSSGRRLTRSQVLLTARAVSTEHCVCFVVHFFSAQFLVHFLSNGGDRGLRVRKLLLRQYGFDVCLWRVDRHFVTSRLRDESTGWRVDRVTSRLAAYTYGEW